MSQNPTPEITLISLASKQIWPQLSIWRTLHPIRVLLLHSSDRKESEGPANRLQTLLTAYRTPTQCESTPHDDYEGIQAALDSLANRHGLGSGNTMLNFTGGNKLMATAAFSWAKDHGIPCCYLERGNQLVHLEIRDGHSHSWTEKLDADITDDLDALDIVHCQLDGSEIERPGELLTLNSEGRNMPLHAWDAAFQKNPGNLLQHVQCSNPHDNEEKQGDHLEILAAAVLLKLGVATLRRSMRIRPVNVSLLPGYQPLENEFDLVFNHGGRLWVVDCKDRTHPENLAIEFGNSLKKLKDNPLQNPLFRKQWGRIQSEISSSPMKTMKEDILAAQSLGGLLGQVICVRRLDPSPEIRNFAKSKGIHIVTFSNLFQNFQTIPGLFN